MGKYKNLIMALIGTYIAYRFGSNAYERFTAALTDFGFGNEEYAENDEEV